MTKYVSCEDCLYGEFCHQFDPFFGCENGKEQPKPEWLLYEENNDNKDKQE